METQTAHIHSVAREESLRVKLIPYVDRYGLIALVLLMMAILGILEPKFFTLNNIFNVVRQITVNATLALGQYLVILTAGIDLSIGSIMALAMYTLAALYERGAPWWIVIFLPPLVGLFVGWLNGLGLTKLRLPHPFISTLGMMNIARGVTNLLSEGRSISGMPPQVRFLGASDIKLGAGISIPVSLVVIAILYVGFWAYLQYIPKGRHIFALGGSPQAARVSGINVDRTLILVYALCGALAGVAALLLVGRTGSFFPNAGVGDELDAIAAVIIGGASFFGGRGSPLGVLAGALIIGMLHNGLNLLNVSVHWQQVLIGSVIILAVYMDVLRRKAGSNSG
jgi:ribose transport system permease protein